MHLSRTLKAILLIFNHVGATFIPPPFIIASRLENESPSVKNNLASSGVGTSGTSLPRQNRQENDSCECRKRCPKAAIIDPKNCSRCIRCPPGTKPDPTRKICIKDDDGRYRRPSEQQQPDEKDPDEKEKEKEKPKDTTPEAKKQEKEEKFVKKKQQKAREHKDKHYPKKKDEMTKKYDKKQASKSDNDERNRVRRMGRCLPLVVLAMGAAAAAIYADEFFDEEYLESMELLQLWPENFPIEAWLTEESDKVFEEDAYIDKWTSFGNDNKKRDILSTDFNDANVTDHQPVEIHTSTSSDTLSSPPASMTTVLAVYNPHEKRFFWLIPIFLAVVTTAARVASSVARVATKLTRQTIKIGSKSASIRSRNEKNDGAKKIASDKNWKQCLLKQGPNK